jgi:hypothetical protein
MFSVDLREMLRDRMIGCSVATENDSRVPPRYQRMGIKKLDYNPNI